MKHWDGRDRDHVVQLRLPRRDRHRLAALFATPVRPRRKRNMDSVVGLVLAVGLLAFLAWVLSPVDPVSPDVLR